MRYKTCLNALERGYKMIEFLLTSNKLKISYVRCNICSHHYFLVNGVGSCPIGCRLDYTTEDCDEVKIDTALSKHQFQEYMENVISNTIDNKFHSLSCNISNDLFRQYYNTMGDKEKAILYNHIKKRPTSIEESPLSFNYYFESRYKKEQ